MKKLLFAFVAILLGTVVSTAAGIDGKWKTTMEGPNGSMDLVFTFKVDGPVMTGTVSTPMGEMPISDGKFDGKEFSFNVDMNGSKIQHKGTLEGETLKMKVTGLRGPDGNSDGEDHGQEMVLNRVVQ